MTTSMDSMERAWSDGGPRHVEVTHYDDVERSFRVIKADVRHNRVGVTSVFDTYTVPLHSVNKFFAREDGSLITKDWNKKYAAAQAIFNGSLESAILLSMTHTVHNRLYNGTFGLTPTEEVTLTCGDDFLRMFHWGRVPLPAPFILTGLTGSGHAVSGSGGANEKDAPFTYVITTDGVLRFSQTVHKDAEAMRDVLAVDLPSSIDFMSKHAVMANGAREVVYAGELWVARVGSGCRVLVIDNGSGTYAPGTEEGQLRRLEALLKHNFPGLPVLAKRYADPLLLDALSEAAHAVPRFRRGVSADSCLPFAAPAAAVRRRGNNAGAGLTTI